MRSEQRTERAGHGDQRVRARTTEDRAAPPVTSFGGRLLALETDQKADRQSQPQAQQQLELAHARSTLSRGRLPGNAPQNADARGG